MNAKKFLILLPLLGVFALVMVVTSSSATAQPVLTSQEQLGKMLFFDQNLSDPPGQACADCHGPGVGFTGPDEPINVGGAVYEGAVAGRFGNRKPPASAYAGDSPILYFDGQSWIGGIFWDGRATGWTLGDPLAEQALGPFLNPLEQNNASPQVVIDKVLASSYAGQFQQICIEPVTYYECIGRSIAAYERSTEVNSFSSKFDAYVAKKTKLTKEESKGYKLFTGKAKCSNCHVLSDKNKKAENSTFTDFTYDNIGVPKNPDNPFYNEPDWNPLGTNWLDTGLGGFLQLAGYPETIWGPELGKEKVPTLRNVDLRPTNTFVKAYTHNGYFKTLEGIVHFYNTRDVLPRCTGDLTEAEALAANCWPAPEVAQNLNTSELGNLKLSAEEEADIVAFLKTLSDGYQP